MADVLTMAARELRNPVSVGVLLEARDRLLHGYQGMCAVRRLNPTMLEVQKWQ
jgi:hypothetical protein